MSQEEVSPGEVIAVVGSRDYDRLETVHDQVASLPDGVIVVTGGARGVDAVAEDAAREAGLDVRVMNANWSKYRKAAGPIRNKKLVTKADKALVFWDGESPGARNALKEMMIQEVPRKLFVSCDPDKAQRELRSIDREVGDTREMPLTEWVDHHAHESVDTGSNDDDNGTVAPS